MHMLNLNELKFMPVNKNIPASHQISFLLFDCAAVARGYRDESHLYLNSYLKFKIVNLQFTF